MISFFVTRANAHCIRDYLQARGAALADAMRVVEYEQLGGLTRIPAGGVIFAALDQTSPAENDAIARIRDQVSRMDPRLPLLNDPRRVLRRFDLLSRLHESGCNRFKAARALDDPAGLRYPVFLRREHHHDGSLTPLLHDRRALDRALGELVFRGIPVSEVLVVEFCDTSDADGLFRKYSAMRIGDVILPRHLHAGRDWIVKSHTSIVDERLALEEAAYVERHPHERWLKAVFDLARIEYGRIDYGVWRGEPQVWEINTNPTLGRNAARAARSGEERERRLREAGRAAAHQRMLDAFGRLNRAGPAGELPIVIDSGLRARLDAENARSRGRSRGPAALAVIRRHPAIRRIMKGIVLTATAPLTPAVARLLRARRLPHGSKRLDAGEPAARRG